ncbi:phenylacetate--CoA ligase family protein [Roseimaritima ulvae]|uniref:Phenylacetate-coenzyme A ligase n=1 Tax=Roseimaritima ulvae TaxID=980254 RepID=A0A5B9QK62_9BACT|nr:phenylacetate--CoA ligase family protein [Roseimaritima ulvae]QEG38369.1 Phenylacetate-coenzyme A ligase [Roseimaritima ulvae]
MADYPQFDLRLQQQRLTPLERQRALRLDRDALGSLQLDKLNRMLAGVLPHCPFYQDKYGCTEKQLQSLEQLVELPLLTKSELVDPTPGSPARFHYLPRQRYVRFHQTSGTSGRPMPVLDSAADWQWWIDTWQFVLDAAQVTADDTVAMAFSFGPFIGFWSAHDAIVDRQALVIPAGGMSTTARLQLILHGAATVLCCTPTYALHLADVAAKEGLDLAGSRVARIIVAGEPGGSIPEVRQRIEQAWGARVIDHSGASELGPWGVGAVDGSGLYVIESEFIVETLRPGSEQPADEGELAELVLTGLGRWGGPAIRYRTGDLVRVQTDHDHDSRFRFLPGGVLGRADDMLVIRGVNVFPSGVESVVRSIDGLGEFRMIATRVESMDQLEIDVEGSGQAAARLAAELQIRLGLRIPVRAVPADTLPRSEAKSRRLDDRRR